MKRRTINTVVVFGILSIISVLLVQMMWINRTIKAQLDAVEIQAHQDSLNLHQFEESVLISLKKVIEEVNTSLADSSDLYGAVKQERMNYFLVDINENLHPYYLEQLLKRTFYDNGINQDFQYGIYDCYNDDIVYSNLIRYSRDSLYSQADEKHFTSPELKWKKDGHYFSVYFPEMEEKSNRNVEANMSPWISMVVIAILLLIFFAYAISIIIRQKKMAEVRTDFVNNMTHELKTPISTIALSSELLMEGDFANDQERIKKYAAVIHKENKRLEQQVERVLNMAKLDKNELDFRLKKTDLHDLIQEVVSSFQFNQRATIDLSLHAKNSIVMIDVVHISNILFNLLDNAEKYTDEHPKILIASRNIGNEIEIIIKDNGIGIDKNEIKYIFEQFYRVPTGDRHDVKGFGLGLYYVKLIVEEHKGTIEVKSQLNVGTQFSIRLPNTKQ